MTHEAVLNAAALLILIVGPALTGAVGLVQARRKPDAAPSPPAGWKLTILSTLLYTLAFNLIFFIQELFLVLPKAFTPGLRPTLFHNNHVWEGDNPLAHLFQGTGALAIFIIGVVCALLLRRRQDGSTNLRLFLFWMAFAGLYMALLQVANASNAPRSDVGVAFAYLEFGATAQTAAALAGLAAIPAAAFWLLRPLLDLADAMGAARSAGARSRFVFMVATLPSLLALPLIALFRIPREWSEVLLFPALVTFIGIVWLQAAAWRVGGAPPGGGKVAAGSFLWPAGSVLLLLLVFQLLLRPGIHFY